MTCGGVGLEGKSGKEGAHGSQYRTYVRYKIQKGKDKLNRGRQRVAVKKKRT